eukprot:CAMPEP_0198282406 /NCGR_PEP_ID=MMETSP1449-20131203/2242_1 /TAXON_ID=420275 /ORGANISM="Attheya septentrionalis, Strain CCMP2084" /LENGTH=108 /DNA_ID=CAMNT_0043978661 /DNA_START=85 /DNA_END=408 /DNA_ORIENTATION=-
MTPPIPVARATLVGEIRPSEPNVMYAVVDTTEPQECVSDSFVDEPSEEMTTRVGHMHTMEHTGTLRHLGRLPVTLTCPYCKEDMMTTTHDAIDKITLIIILVLLLSFW